jgi:SAM-dependent methyltransferase
MMSIKKFAELITKDDFPLSSHYDPELVLECQMGPNALWLTEWLTEEMKLQPGMRVLDMGCGRCLSSIFLVREFGVRVWAADLWIEPSENWERVRKLEMEDYIFPLHCEAHSLPFPEGFFDAIVSLDSYHYYGTNDIFIESFSKLVKPGGQIGIVIPGFMKEVKGMPPACLTTPRKDGGTFWTDECWSFHTREWWERHWDRMSCVQVELTDTLDDGWKHWLDWEKALAVSGKELMFPPEIEPLEADRGEYMGFIRMIARRSAVK